MKKSDQNCVDSVETHIDSPDNPMTSFHFRSNFSSFRVEKVDQSTSTDQLVCNCACEEIPKLKDKAHKSFMQVIQIQNLYKEEINQLKQYYTEREKNKDKQSRYKEQLLNDKCKELENQLQKLKQTYKMEKAHQIQIESNPFIIDGIDNINYNPLDQSNQSAIYGLKDFIFKKNINEHVSGFQKEMNQKLNQISLLAQNQSIKSLIDQCQGVFKKLANLTKELKEETVTSCQRYNQIIKNNNESEGKYSKLTAINQSLQRQAKFMTNHIKRLSQEKLKMEKKINQLQRNNKALQQYIKIAKGQQKRHSQFQQDIQSEKNAVFINTEGELDVSVQTLMSSKTYKKNNGSIRNSNPVDTIEQPQNAVFKKKGHIFQKMEK